MICAASLNQVILGRGSPDARHSSVTGSESFTMVFEGCFSILGALLQLPAHTSNSMIARFVSNIFAGFVVVVVVVNCLAEYLFESRAVLK